MIGRTRGTYRIELRQIFEKMSTLYFAIVLLIVTILILLLWYGTEYFENWIFSKR